MMVSLYLLGVAELMQMLPVVHLLLVVAVIGVIVVCCKEQHERHNAALGEVLLGLVMVCLSAFIGLPLFYLEIWTDYSCVFRACFLAFVLLLGLSTLRQLAIALQDAVKNQVYRQLAYLDSMTRAANRSAFDERVAALSKMERGRALLFLFDLDHLKDVNDTHGHAAGDAYIIGFAQTLLSVFGAEGKVYRIGGDEFAVLEVNVPDTPGVQLRRLADGMKRFNETAPHPVSYSAGYAEAPLGPGWNFDGMFRMADEMMYREKRSHSDESIKNCSRAENLGPGEDG